MSEAETTNATATDLAAADWVQRRHLWAWTQSDQSELDAWLGEAEANHIAYLRQTAVWNAAGRLSALRHQPMRIAPAHPEKRPYFKFAAIAAATVVVAASLAGRAYFKTPADTTYVTSIGGHKIITLADGTQIELNTDSALQVGAGPVRHVRLLRGEAFFDVHHDGANPFAVTAGGYRITDIGTKFSIRTSANAVKVSLLEGSAVVAPLNGHQVGKSALLMPGDVAIASADKLTVDKGPVANVATSLGWRRGVLTFKDTELAQAVQEFNRYNARKLKIEDPLVGHLKINGTFQAENADLFASSVQELFGLRISKNTNETTLLR